VHTWVVPRRYASTPRRRHRRLPFSRAHPREAATLIWVGVLAAVLVAVARRDRDLRESLLDLVRLAVAPPISVVILAFYAYTSACVALMHRIGAWNAGLLRETLLWGAVSGLAVVLTAADAGRRPDVLPASSAPDRRGDRAPRVRFRPGEFSVLGRVSSATRLGRPGDRRDTR
jgi:hypothetical protein